MTAPSISSNAEKSRLRIYVCGRLAIEAGDTVVLERDFPGRQVRLMWVYLALRRQHPVGREDLADAIWGDSIPDGWDVALNSLASRLRSTLQPITEIKPVVRLRGDARRYELHLPSNTFVDLERARIALHEAESALRIGELERAGSAAGIATVIAARGFLSGENAPWIEGQRRLLNDLRIHAMECTAEVKLRRGDPRLAAREAEELIAIDPLNESAYRLQMRASAALGNNLALVRILDNCRRALREQANLEPSERTLRLFEQLTSQR